MGSLVTIVSASGKPILKCVPAAGSDSIPMEMVYHGDPLEREVRVGCGGNKEMLLTFLGSTKSVTQSLNNLKGYVMFQGGS